VYIRNIEAGCKVYGRYRIAYAETGRGYQVCLIIAVNLRVGTAHPAKNIGTVAAKTA